MILLSGSLYPHTLPSPATPAMLSRSRVIARNMSPFVHLYISESAVIQYMCQNERQVSTIGYRIRRRSLRRRSSPNFLDYKSVSPILEPNAVLSITSSR